jgi:hypothetical protein
MVEKHTTEELGVIENYEQSVNRSYDVFGWLGLPKDCSEKECSIRIREVKEKPEVIINKHY